MSWNHRPRAYANVDATEPSPEKKRKHKRIWLSITLLLWINIKAKLNDVCIIKKYKYTKRYTSPEKKTAESKKQKERNTKKNFQTRKQNKAKMKWTLQ